MPGVRCPNCAAINPDGADECSLCGQHLARGVGAPIEADPRRRGVALAPAVPSVEARVAAAQMPGLRFERAAPAAGVFRLTGMGALTSGLMLAFVGTALLLVTTLITFVWSTVNGFFQHSTTTPVFEILDLLVLVPVTRVPPLPLLLGLVVIGALLGAAVGAAFALSRSLAGGAVIGAAAFMAMRIWVLVNHWSVVMSSDPFYRLVWGPALVVADGAFGGIYGIFTAFTLRAYLDSMEA